MTGFFLYYYRTPRGFHPRSIKPASAWTAATPMPFFSFPMMSNIELVLPRPIMLTAGENAHSQVVNETDNPLEWTIEFSADSAEFPGSVGSSVTSYFKILIPPPTP